VCSWLAMSYALGHHLMVRLGLVMDPVQGLGLVRRDHGALHVLTHFVKKMARLLDGYEAVRRRWWSDATRSAGRAA